MNQLIRGWPAPLLALVIACLGSANGASASTAIWRCGNSYSDRPCAGATQIDAPAAPTAQQRRQADEGIRNDQAAAQRMERERVRLEAAAAAQRGALVIGESPTSNQRQKHEPSSMSKARKPKLNKGRTGAQADEFVASSPTPAAKPRKKKSKSSAGD